MPDGLADLSADITELEKEMILDNTREIAMNYEILEKRGRDGRLGKTATFWIMYLHLMKHQHITHTAVQENDLEMKLYAWESMLPFYLYFNKTNYAQYGTYTFD